MSQTSREKQAILAAFTEGASIRGVERQLDVHRDTAMRIGVRAGKAAQAFHDERMRNLPCRDLQCDEQWPFIFKKERHRKDGDPADAGDIWVWNALDRDTRAVASFRIGKRDALNAQAFMRDLRSRLTGRPQLSVDGLALYIEAIERAFGGACDFATIVKSYVAEPMGPGKYSPPRVSSVTRTPIVGNPDPARISTSHVERLHLSNRMRNRRMTRLVDSYSKKRENFEASVALTYWIHKWARRHHAHKVTPAQALGLATDPLTLHDLLDYADYLEARSATQEN